MDGCPGEDTRREAEPPGWVAAALERKLGMEVRRMERIPSQNQGSQGKEGLERGQMNTVPAKSVRQNTGCDGPNGMEGGETEAQYDCPGTVLSVK